MARIKAWRLAVLASIPVALFVLRAQWFSEGWYSGRGHSFHDDVQAAVWNLNRQGEPDERIEALARSAARSQARGTVELVPLGVVLPERMADLRREINDELARLPARDSSSRVTVVIGQLGGGLAQIVMTPEGTLWDPCVIRPEMGGWPTRADSFNVVLPPVLGQCALVAAFGAPGPAVRSWVAGIRARWRRPALARGRPERMDSTGTQVISPEELGTWGYWQAEDLRFFACRSADAAACKALLEHPWQGGLRGDFIWWLARERPEQFRQFWQADGHYDAAAQSSFGESARVLLSRYLATKVQLTGRGPVPPPEAPVAVASVLALALLTSLLLARRRTVA